MKLSLAALADGCIARSNKLAEGFYRENDHKASQANELNSCFKEGSIHLSLSTRIYS
jgi:hypothetical protein